MDFSFTPEQERFRQEICAFLERELSPREERQLAGAAGTGNVDKEFSRKLGRKGWIGLAWPREHGGQGLGHIERLIYMEEMVLNTAPIGYHHAAERQMGPSIIMFGTPEQKRDFLPRIARGECGFAIGYSEPGTGSDLASLETRAMEDGDDFVINGTKIWTSLAHVDDYIWLAARTNMEAPKHRGISVFLVDLKLPGVTIRPIVNMAGLAEFNQVTFDNVRVPKSTMVGERERGWYVVAANLDFERAGIERVAGNWPLFQDVVQYLGQRRVNGGRATDDPRVRNRIAETAIEYTVGKLLCYRVAWMQEQGVVPNREASVSKLFGTEASQRMARTCMDLMGLYGQLQHGEPWAPIRGRVERAWHWAVSATIAGGTSEVLRNVIALRGLGLPRG
ncbi:MAG: acyl-CoA dehydrogenase family protein [Chloroflexi bacterium]|nr:acyl-CoA dehydrogenase family protein [Chloroflexota bacterium]